ncbi:MAG: YkoP family protein [Bacillota bacterium]
MSWVRRLWDGYEVLFARLIGLRSVASGSLLRVRTITYRGQALGQGEGVLRPGDRVLELHLNNRLVSGLAATGREATFRALHRARQELPLLLQAAQESDKPIAGVVGTSLLAVGGRALGFHVQRLPAGPGRRWLALYMRWLGRVYRPQGGPPVQHRRSDIYVTWVTLGELERLAAPGAAVVGGEDMS